YAADSPAWPAPMTTTSTVRVSKVIYTVQRRRVRGHSGRTACGRGGLQARVEPCAEGVRALHAGPQIRDVRPYLGVGGHHGQRRGILGGPHDVDDHVVSGVGSRRMGVPDLDAVPG